MASGLFVTSTDTGAGKTLVACALLHALAREGLAVAGYKPVAAGAETSGRGLRNEDALLLKRFSTARLGYEEVNPAVLEPAIAPHIAANRAGITLAPAALAELRQRLIGRADVIITEGAGGWLVPLSDQTDMADLAAAIGDPVLLVVGMRLGCLNHALLTAESIRSRGAKIAGWVANRLDPSMEAFDENLGCLESRLPCPRIGLIPWLQEGDPEARIQRAAALMDTALVRAAIATP